MDTELEFSTQAYCKMIMHAMKHPHSVCNGFLLSPKPKETIDKKKESQDAQNGDNNDNNNTDDENYLNNENNTNVGDNLNVKKLTKIVEAIPIAHTSHCLTPNIEIAFNSVSNFANEQKLIISGYYQTDRYNEPISYDTFSQRVTEKICEFYPNAVLCFVSFDNQSPRSILDPHQLIDGKWRKKGPQSFSIEDDPDTIANNIFYTKEKLYRQIVDFDDHFNNIALDWTNTSISKILATKCAQIH